jgi:signal transduction histidine kinase
MTVHHDWNCMSSEELTSVDAARSGQVFTGESSVFRSYQLIQGHGGQIEIHSAVGKRTVVNVALPRALEAKPNQRTKSEE